MRKYPIPPRRYYPRRKGQPPHKGGRIPRRRAFGLGAGTALGLGSTVLSGDPLNLKGLTTLETFRTWQCEIKGNISASGERIYHMPGQKYYSRTRISPSRGERWFCSEEEARATGWRRSRV